MLLLGYGVAKQNKWEINMGDRTERDFVITGINTRD